MALSFGQSKRLDGITKDQLRRFADTARIPANMLPSLVLETIEKTVDAWRHLAEKSLLTLALREAIDKQIAGVATKSRLK